jgi:hypothetical protein
MTSVGKDHSRLFFSMVVIGIIVSAFLLTSMLPSLAGGRPIAGQPPN